jgi:hypothetical protein
VDVAVAAGDLEEPAPLAVGAPDLLQGGGPVAVLADRGLEGGQLGAGVVLADVEGGGVVELPVQRGAAVAVADLAVAGLAVGPVEGLGDLGLEGEALAVDVAGLAVDRDGERAGRVGGGGGGLSWS